MSSTPRTAVTIAGRGERDPAGLVVHQQVEVALAVALLDVGEAVVLLGQRAQALRQRAPLVHAQAELAPAAREDLAVDGDHVAQVAVGDRRQARLAEHVEGRVQLQPARAVGQVEEDGLAVAAAAADAARDPQRLAGLGAGLELAELGPHPAASTRSGVRAG